MTPLLFSAARRFLPAAALLLGASGCCTQKCAPSPTAPLSPAPTSRKADGGSGKRFSLLDANGDGKVTRAEFDANFSKVMLAQYDRNGDGAISLAEWRSVERARENKVRDQFADLDANGDRTLSEKELSSGAARLAVVKERFAKLDLNGDGVITQQEASALGVRRESDRDPANHP